MSQINPGNSRAQKLKKLYQISRELINEYGYTYFLRVAFEELFAQKGKLFSPDTIPQDIEDEFILSYDDLLENYSLEKIYHNQNFKVFLRFLYFHSFSL